MLPSSIERISPRRTPLRPPWALPDVARADVVEGAASAATYLNEVRDQRALREEHCRLHHCLLGADVKAVPVYL